MQGKILSGLAIFCQFLALFPVAVITEAAAFGEYVWWHYILMYAVLAGFFCVGRLARLWSIGANFSRRIRPWVMFLARIGFILPVLIFCVCGRFLGLHTGIYLYFMPGCIAAYFAGYLGAGKGYSDIFTRGWFAVYFILAVIGALLINFTYDKSLISGGMTQLCVSFVLLIIGAAVLTNQTSIDFQTHQRAGGKSVLPTGVRSYNAKLILGIAALISALCFLAQPISSGIFALLKMLLRWLLSLIRRDDTDNPELGAMEENTADSVNFSVNGNSFFQLMMYLLIFVLILLAVKFRRQIWSFFRDLLSPLFRLPEEELISPFVDEFADSTERKASRREHQKTKRNLLRKYRRETNPAEKYRVGYELFLTRLAETPFNGLPTDTTTIHSDKGGLAFRERLDGKEIEEMVETYNRVRYGGVYPTTEEQGKLDRLLMTIDAI